MTAQTGDLESLYSGIDQVKLAVSRFPLSLERETSWPPMENSLKRFIISRDCNINILNRWLFHCLSLNVHR